MGVDAPSHLDAQLVGVSKTYPNGEAAVTDLSLDIRHGEFLSLLGPSGCGKSTTLRILAGLEYPTAGTVSIAGKDMANVPPNRRPTNLIFQKLALFPHLTVAENIAFGPRIRRMSRAEVRSVVGDMLDLVELTGYADRKPAQLSGGQQQRVAIARALANRPAVLLLDEPLGALDLRLRVQMQRVLKKIQQDSGTTFVFVTHDQTEAFTVSDRIALMNQGRLEQVGRPDELYNRPATEFGATFLGDTNIVRGTVNDRVLTADGFTCRTSGPGTALSLRPEVISMRHHLTTPFDNRFTARVADLTFQGSTVRYQVALPGDGPDLVVQLPAHEAVGIAPGDEVEIGWQADAAVMLGTEV
ncbi:ABC transporter ATP-binding protein [Streptomyces sp. NBC_01477]|uniref:ABC transporter ATP-binding protein n=1 Tax=Streptomyces sp. NBC_01477 TaxID=2976015 RepID=UPI002E302F1C|nr:ABC transporter ATP-binding protein [Streptomyces sp. NBC_01477]